jgi:hypothetical protein
MFLPPPFDVRILKLELLDATSKERHLLLLKCNYIAVVHIYHHMFFRYRSIIIPIFCCYK